MQLGEFQIFNRFPVDLQIQLCYAEYVGAAGRTAHFMTKNRRESPWKKIRIFPAMIN